MVDGVGGDFFFHRAAEALAQFGGGSLGEGDDEQFVERRTVAFKAVEAAGNERAGLAGARAGHDEDVATRGDGRRLGGRQTGGCRGRCHATGGA